MTTTDELIEPKAGRAPYGHDRRSRRPRFKDLVSDPLAKKLLIAVILISSVVAILATALQLYSDYRFYADRIDQVFEEIQVSQLNSMTHSVWILEQELIEKQLDGIVAMSDISFAEIVTTEGERWAKADGDPERLVIRTLPMIQYHRGEAQNLGDLTIHGDLDAVYSRLWSKLVEILTENVIKTFLVSLGLLVLFRHWITKHMEKIATYSYELNPSDPEGAPLSLDRHDNDDQQDALDILVTSINAMRTRLRRNIEQLESQETQLRLLANNSDAALWMHSEKGCEFTNDAFGKIFGKTADLGESLPWRYWLDVAASADRPALAAHLKRIEVIIADAPPDSVHHLDAERFRVSKPNDTHAWIQARIVIWKTPASGAFRLFGVAYDIDDLVSAQEELKLSNAELERRVADRTRDLQETLDEVRALQAQMVEQEKMASLGGMVAGLAHELNTPIGIGVTAASHISEQIDAFQEKVTAGRLSKSDLTTFVDSVREANDIVFSNTRRTADLVRSFKMVSVDQSSKTTREFKAVEYIREVLNSLAPQLKQSGVEIAVEGEEELSLHGAPGSFAQILTNLVLNAAHHAFPEGQKGMIVITVKRHDQNTVHMMVADNGVGMDEKTRQNIFEPFFTTKRSEGGSGLGLHIVYNLTAQAFGGSIHCTSGPNDGTCFDLYLKSA